MQTAASKPIPITVTENEDGVSDKIEGLIKGRINSLVFMDDRALILAKYFFSREFLGTNDNNYFRKRQRLAIKALIRNLNSGLNGGLIKLPTGLGKTFLFGNIIKALSRPSIILVPRENLVDGTYDELVGSEKKAGIGFEARKVSRIYGKGKGDVVAQVKEILSNGEFNNTLIITYQSFVSLFKRDDELFNELIKNIGCIISDEAHRSLGEQTARAIETLTNNVDVGDDEVKYIEDTNEELEEESLEDEKKAEQKIEDLLERKEGIIHIKTTATKTLSNKEVGGDILYEATLGDAVNDGDLVLPRQTKQGIACIEIGGEKVTANDNNKSLDNYVFEDGIPVYEELTLEYMLEKDKSGGYLPTVAFCNTTEQVEFYVNYLLKNGIRAIQCTTNIDGTNYRDIKSSEEMLESGKADIIVTCSKIGEGWDLPTLRGSMWLVPSSSPARIMQGNGRITRVLKEEDVKRISRLTGISEYYVRKNTNNTIIFSPSKWIYNGTSSGDKSGNGGSGGTTGLDIVGGTISELFTGLELYGQYGELTIEQLNLIGIDFDVKNIKYKKKYSLEELKALNIPEDVLGDDKKWRPYAERINLENQNKVLPISLNGLASLLGCKRIKEEIMRALEINIREQYTIEELKALNIPEGVLGSLSKWKPYAEKINSKNPKKALPLTLITLASLLGCEVKKEEIMKALKTNSKRYTVEELKALNIPEEILGEDRKWRPYAERINLEKPNKVLPLSLKGLVSLLGCKRMKEEIIVSLGMSTKEQYTLEELKALNIPEDVLGDDKKWRPYAEKINIENPKKALPLTLGGLASVLGCGQRKEEIMKALGMSTKEQYTLEELKALNIPEDVLGDDKKWRPYAEKINIENPEKALPLSLNGLASLFGCGQKKEELMRFLGINIREQYTLEELKILNIPEEVLGVHRRWRPYAEKINIENPKKALPLSLNGLASLFGCGQKKEELMRALGINIREQYTLEELKALNIPEEVLIEDKRWKTYAEKINLENPKKALPLSLIGLSSLLGCKKRKGEIMKALGKK